MFDPFINDDEGLILGTDAGKTRTFDVTMTCGGFSAEDSDGGTLSTVGDSNIAIKSGSLDLRRSDHYGSVKYISTEARELETR